MPAAGTAKKYSAASPLRAQALAIGAFPANAPLVNLFARSHWTLALEPTVIAAAERLARERFAAVICHAAHWKQVVEMIGQIMIGQATIGQSEPRYDTHPIVIALSENPAQDDWLQAIGSHVHFLDGNQISAPELFPLLNHAWRVCSEVRP
jgi:hypothetical protein